MYNSFDYISGLQYQVKTQEKIIEGFKSGERYRIIQDRYDKNVNELRRMLKKVKRERDEARETTVHVRNIWFEIFDKLEEAYKKQEKKLLKELEKEKEQRIRAEAKRDEYHTKYTEKNRELYDVKTELEEERGRNKKLTAQLNRDYENSSIPSSMSENKKKITNSREKTGRKPGGQPGHAGHCRKKQEPTGEPVLLMPPQEVLQDPDFKKTKKKIIKQMVGIHVMLEVKEYHADIYYNSKTGERTHAAFPEGVVNDVNYDGSIKAFLFLLNHDCCTSIDKSRRFLYDLTGGKLDISKGMINGLSKEFSKKTQKEQQELFQRLLMSPVLHTDCTNARENGNSAYVFVCTTPKGETMYFARPKKGHEGVKGTPVEDYQGILVHDHEVTFYKYGSGHQECLAHVLRYLKDSMENEPERIWNREMHALIQEMIHYRNRLEEGTECDRDKVTGYEKKYFDILEKAKKEYDDVPASEYYRDGYKLYRRMKKYSSSHLLFLHDMRVPHNNNASERSLRAYKRKQKQAVSFRSFDTIDQICQCMSMLVLMRKKGDNLFDRVSRIFG